MMRFSIVSFDSMLHCCIHYTSVSVLVVTNRKQACISILVVFTVTSDHKHISSTISFAHYQVKFFFFIVNVCIYKWVLLTGIQTTFFTLTGMVTGFNCLYYFVLTSALFHPFSETPHTHTHTKMWIPASKCLYNLSSHLISNGVFTWN